MLRLLLPFAVIISLAVTSCRTSPADGVYRLELYAHGDVHGCFFDSLPRIQNYLSQRKSDAGEDNVISIDLGDHIHGSNSAYYYNYVHDYQQGEKHIFSRIAEYMGYDAIVAGNHDIETGREIFGKIRNEISIPYLAANVVWKDSGEPYFTPYTIFMKQGISIAVIGLTTPEVKKWLGSEKIAGLDILPIQNIAGRIVEEVREKHSPHLIFLAVHAGCGNGSGEDIENPCKYLAASIKGIDGVLAAHDHIAYCGKEWNGSDSVVVINSGPYAQNLSGIRIEMEFEDGKVAGKKLEASLIKMREITPDSGYITHFQSESKAVDEFSSMKLGSIDEEIDPKMIFDGPCLYSNLIHHVQLEESSARVSFVSPTKFRGVVQAGDICYNDVLKLYPFENILYKVEMTGAQIRNYLELSYNNWKSRPVAFDCAGGLEYEVDFTRPYGSRVKVISFTDGAPFDENATYPVAMASYRANGGGDLLLQATGLNLAQLDGIVLEKYRPVRNLIYDFFEGETRTAAGLAAVSKWSVKE